jgi:hypothetical protein
MVKTTFRTLIERMEWIVAIAVDFCGRTWSNAALAAVALELKAYLPFMQTVVANAWRAQVMGEVSAAAGR